jgi:Rad3-related DNA helicase
VLGGAFAEGIDLPGQRLVGAFIATLGLPQFNPVNEEICHRLQSLFGARLGHDYTYLYPGLQKVVQAAGRVIRSPHDEGVLVLMDERFMQPHVRRLLPTWWAAPRLAVPDQASARVTPDAPVDAPAAPPSHAVTSQISADAG